MEEELSPDQVASLAQAQYETKIRATVEKDHAGEYLVMDITSGQFVVGPDRMAVSNEARRRFPGGTRFLMRIGHPAAIRIGFRGDGP